MFIIRKFSLNTNWVIKIRKDNCVRRLELVKSNIYVYFIYIYVCVCVFVCVCVLGMRYKPEDRGFNSQ